MSLSFAALDPTTVAIGVTGLVISAIALFFALLKESRENQSRDMAARELKVIVWFEQLPPSGSASIEEAAAGVGLTDTETSAAVENLISAGKIERIRGLSRFRFCRHRPPVF
jgi:DNA-binding MarR family transcriptional regulator